MDEEPKQKEESWAVEPPKEGGRKAGKALRVALLVAALAAVAAGAGVILFGREIRRQFQEMACPGIIGTPVKSVENRSATYSDAGTAESTGATIAGGYTEIEGE